MISICPHMVPTSDEPTSLLHINYNIKQIRSYNPNTGPIINILNSDNATSHLQKLISPSVKLSVIVFNNDLEP